MRRPSFIKPRSKLDKVITFQRRGAATDEFNAPVETNWVDLFSTRCAVYPAPGYEKYQSAQNAATAIILIEVRSEIRTRGLKPADRCVIDGQKYNIVAPPDQLERGRNIQISAAYDT